MDSTLPPPNGDRRAPLESPSDRADDTPVSTTSTAGTTNDADADAPVTPTSDAITASMHQLLEHVVGPVPGVVGAVVASADGFVLASRLAPDSSADTASVAAMSAALLGLANRLAQSVAPGPSHVVELRSEDAHGYVFAVAHAAVLTVLATSASARAQVVAVGREVTVGVLRLLGDTDDG